MHESLLRLVSRVIYNDEGCDEGMLDLQAVV